MTNVVALAMCGKGVHVYDTRSTPPTPGVTPCLKCGERAAAVQLPVGTHKQRVVDFLNHLSSRLGIGTRHSVRAVLLEGDSATRVEAKRRDEWVEI